jgi:hypothetical protein
VEQHGREPPGVGLCEVTEVVMSAVVEQQPGLRAGRHQHPDDGVCLMEYVSMMAGDTFTDAPRCTDPLLAELARLVNDTIGEQARDSLMGMAPRLVALPRTGSSAGPIVAAALDAVLCGRPDRKDLLRHRRRALRRAATDVPRSRRLDRLTDTLYRYGPARHALSCGVYVAAEHSGSEAERDAVLTAMLDAALSAAEGLVRA